MRILRRLARFLVLFVILLLARFLYPLLYQLFIPAGSVSTDRQTLMIAHRGASGVAPENTLASFAKALDQGADMLELDIHLSRDGIPVVIHDATLERTTNGHGRVVEYDLAALKQLDAGSWFASEYAGEHIPTLDEVLTLVNGRAPVIIEFKWDKEEGYYPQMAAKVAAIIRAHQASGWCWVQSYEQRYLDEMYRLLPEVPLVKCFIGVWSGPLGFYYDTGFHWGNYRPANYLKGLNLYYRTLTRSQVARLHQAGLQVWSYTVNDPKNMNRQVNLGVDGIITNYPEADY
ncbi:MAG TPA: glycerophosphodiester phosphodiesterase [Flammeovirgaceae bacterium]|nr:glycerophosphodiester phosphodiesterase [Flammeovirgaceae bacterium]